MILLNWSLHLSFIVRHRTDIIGFAATWQSRAGFEYLFHLLWLEWTYVIWIYLLSNVEQGQSETRCLSALWWLKLCSCNEWHFDLKLQGFWAAAAAAEGLARGCEPCKPNLKGHCCTAHAKYVFLNKFPGNRHPRNRFVCYGKRWRTVRRRRPGSSCTKLYNLL